MNWGWVDEKYVPLQELEEGVPEVNPERECGCPGCDSHHISLEQQLEWFDLYAQRAAEVLVTHIYAKRDQLIAQARERGIGGYETYRDELCHNPDPMGEADEELADAIWYVAEYLRRQR